MSVRRSWWRENRRWLAALPVALVTVAAASSYDLKDFWYDQGIHHEIAAAAPATSVHVVDDYDDAVGRTSRTFDVELVDLEPSDTYPYPFDEPGPPPDGVDVIAVHLSWKAAPDQVLLGCSVALVDDQGRRYEAEDVWQCVPEDHPGPSDPLTGGERGAVAEGEDRPPTWKTAPVVLVPHDRRIRQVLVWWDRPDYVRLSVP